MAPTWSLPAWSASIPFAIASNLLTAASRMASGRSSLYFIERAPPSMGSAPAYRKSVRECVRAVDGCVVPAFAAGLAIQRGLQFPDRRIRRMLERAERHQGNTVAAVTLGF